MMTDEEKELAYLATRPGWDLLKQIEADETRIRMNKLADRSRERQEKDPDDALWGEIRGMRRLISRVEDLVSEAQERERDTRI